MDSFPQYFVDGPAIYRISIPGRLNQDWADKYWEDAEVTCEPAAAQTISIITIRVIDQANLLGIVNALYNMGYGIVSLEQVILPDESGEEE